MPLHRRTLLQALVTLPAGFAASARAQTPDRSTAALQAAVDGSHRSAANRARDGARHPVDTLRFMDVQADHTVIELSPGGGWYTEILAPLLREQGLLYAATYAADDAREGARKARKNFEAKLAAVPAVYDRVRLITLPTGPRFTDPLPAGGVDRVLTFRNIHNWLDAGHLDESLQAFAAALKPGGVFGVEEHRAKPGTPVQQMKDTGYIAEDFLIERARAAGLVLQARSEINANPRDTKDHAQGVWALPPTLAGGDADRARFLAIGESDRFTHRYVKA